jgi:threonine synthase
VEVIILYPSKKVSSIQELQLTSLGKNVHAFEVEGTFDDCQSMVKKAFADEDLNQRLFLTSANSINVARWLPQQFYYFFAWQQWPYKDQPMIISVPSGNFGNICAGLLAQHSGLPVRQFIAACNTNDVVTSYLKTGNYEMKPAVATISNAMDVGHPSNFIRILELFDHKYNQVKNNLTSYSITDEETRNTIKEVYTNDHYLADPHGAVGYIALQKYLSEHVEDKGIFLETAHPIKFYDVVEPILHKVIDMPVQIKQLLDQKKKSVQIKAEYGILKDFLLANQ